MASSPINHSSQTYRNKQLFSPSLSFPLFSSVTDNSGKLLLGSMQAPREMILFINMLKELANMSAKGEAEPKSSYEPSQVKSKVNQKEKEVGSHPGIWGDSVLIWYCSSPIPISIVYSCSSPKYAKDYLIKAST